MPDYIVTPEGRRLKKIATRTTTPVSDTTPKVVYADAPRFCYNMPNEEFFPLMMRLRDKAVRLMDDRIAELARWSSVDRSKVVRWFGEDSQATRHTLSGGLIRMHGVMRELTENNFVKFTPEGVRGVGCEPRTKEGQTAATASVCKADGTYTIFIDTKFCQLPIEEIDKDGIPLDGDSKLLVLIHEVSHFPVTMNSEDKWYVTRWSKMKAKQRDEFCIVNAENIAAYVVNIGD